MTTTCIYHIMIDRFAGCDKNRPWRSFKGGNLKGIIGKLDYIQELGCNGIMLTPFYKTNEYHGYHILDYEQVDEHFGTWNDVDALVSEVHRRNMTITADFVANHCHKDNPLVSNHPDWFKRNRNGRLKGFESIDILPEFNLNHPDARKYMTDRGLELCSHGFDAIRLDYAKGPSITFWKSFRQAIKQLYPHVLLIGEVWGKPKDKCLPLSLQNAVGRKQLSVQEAWQVRYAGVFDGVLDFEFQSLMCGAARSRGGFKNNKTLVRKTNRHFAHYTAFPEYQLWLFLDNHDTNRFLFECRGNIERLKDAITFLSNQHHPHLLYYGTECGMTHVGNLFSDESYADEQVRECMDWNGTKYQSI